jgi:hypothetical protein
MIKELKTPFSLPSCMGFYKDKPRELPLNTSKAYNTLEVRYRKYRLMYGLDSYKLNPSQKEKLERIIKARTNFHKMSFWDCHTEAHYIAKHYIKLKDILSSGEYNCRLLEDTSKLLYERIKEIEEESFSIELLGKDSHPELLKGEEVALQTIALFRESFYTPTTTTEEKSGEDYVYLQDKTNHRYLGLHERARGRYKPIQKR